MNRPARTVDLKDDSIVAASAKVDRTDALLLGSRVTRGTLSLIFFAGWHSAKLAECPVSGKPRPLSLPSILEAYSDQIFDGACQSWLVPTGTYV